MLCPCGAVPSMIVRLPRPIIFFGLLSQIPPFEKAMIQDVKGKCASDFHHTTNLAQRAVNIWDVFQRAVVEDQIKGGIVIRKALRHITIINALVNAALTSKFQGFGIKIASGSPLDVAPYHLGKFAIATAVI